MKQMLQYMLNMVASTEHEAGDEKYVTVAWIRIWNGSHFKHLNQFYYSQNTEMHALRLTMGKHATSIYALESMLYLTTGIMDKHNNTNIDLETAVFKVNHKQ